MDIKCNRCDKLAEYVVDGNAVCKDHRDGKEPQTDKSAVDAMVGN